MLLTSEPRLFNNDDAGFVLAVDSGSTVNYSRLRDGAPLGTIAVGAQAAFTDPMWVWSSGAFSEVHGYPAVRGGNSGPLTVSDATASGTAHQFTLSPREDPALGFAVPTVRSSGTDLQTALDIMPNGSPAPGGNGYTWIDVCDADGLVGTYVGSTARVGIHSDHVEISSRGFGATAKRIDMSANMINNNQIPQFQVNPGNSTLSSNFPTTPGNVQVGKDGSDVFLGRPGAQLAVTDTKGWTYLRNVSGTPTAALTGLATQSTAMAFDPVTFKLWAFVGGTWKSVTFA